MTTGPAPRTHITRYGVILDFGGPDQMREWAAWLCEAAKTADHGVLVLPSLPGAPWARRGVEYALERRES